MRVGWYFVRSIAGWYVGLTVLLAALVLSWTAVLPVPRSGMPAPWAMMGPLFLAACFIVWRRARHRGELMAMSASGIGGLGVFVPTCILGLVLQVLFAIPSGRMPETRFGTGSMRRSVEGDLFLEQKGRGVLLDTAGRLRIVAATLPPGFRPAPHNPRRYRRQAFYTQAPRWSPADPLDPCGWRFLYALLVVAVPAGLMTSRRSRHWWLGLLPLLMPLAIL